MDPDHVSTQLDDKGVPLYFKLVFDVDGKQAAFMNDLDKKFQELYAPGEGVDWFPILLEKAEHSSSFAMRVSSRNTCFKIHDGGKLVEGRGWDFIKEFPFQNAKAKVAFTPARIWEKNGKAGVALEATMLVLQAGEFRAKMEDCFGLEDI